MGVRLVRGAPLIHDLRGSTGRGRRGRGQSARGQRQRTGLSVPDGDDERALRLIKCYPFRFTGISPRNPQTYLDWHAYPQGRQLGEWQTTTDSKDNEPYPDERRDLPLLRVGMASLVIETVRFVMILISVIKGDLPSLALSV